MHVKKTDYAQMFSLKAYIWKHNPSNFYIIKAL